MKDRTTTSPRLLQCRKPGAFTLLLGLALPALLATSVSASDTREPARVYSEVCAYCHAQDQNVGPDITMEVPESAHDSWTAHIQSVVRNGRAAMPAFTESSISDSELEALAEALAKGEFADNNNEE